MGNCIFGNMVFCNYRKGNKMRITRWHSRFRPGDTKQTDLVPIKIKPIELNLWFYFYICLYLAMAVSRDLIPAAVKGNRGVHLLFVNYSGISITKRSLRISSACTNNLYTSSSAFPSQAIKSKCCFRLVNISTAALTRPT